MNTQHTQGRLHVAGQYKVQIRSDSHQVAKAWSLAGKTGQENARRLVACWNACDGLHTESLECNKPLGDQLVDAINQRDELLEALKDARRKLAWFTDSYPQDIVVSESEFFGPIDAAIAKATGEQA